MTKFTLQWRITILTALVLAVCSVSLTVASIFNAGKSYGQAILSATEATAFNEDGSVQNETPELAITPAQKAQTKFNATSIVICLLITAVGTVAVYFAVGKSLQSLREIADEVDKIDEKTLSKQLKEVNSGDEIQKLTHGFNKMLTRLNDSFLRQKRFTSNAAHELKTPLATIKTGVQVLRTDRAASLTDYQDYADKTLISVDRLTHIVDDLLLMASVSEFTGSMEEEVLLEPLIESIQYELAFELEKRKITLLSNCGELTAKGNPSFLYRIFFNLIENACKYGNEGGNVWINATSLDDFVRVLIKDDGPGIDSKSLPYIFDEFYRVDKSRSREIGGAGLGLSLVKSMVEATNGTIKVKSDGMNGTCFTVVLPS